MNEASNVYGEMYDQDGSHVIATGVAAAYSPFATATPGLRDPYGSVQYLPATRSTWDAARRYGVGTIVAYDGYKYTATEASLTPWAAGTTYDKDDTVEYGGEDYVSLKASNKGHLPTEAGSDWWVLANLNKEPGVATDWWTKGAALSDVLKVTADGLYRLKASVFFTGDAGSVFTWKIYRNSVALAGVFSCAITAAAATEHALGFEGLVRLTYGDEIDLWVAGSAGSETITILSAYVSVVRMAE